MCTYLKLRGSVYCFRRSIPEHLRAIIGRQEFSKSLRTKDRAEAKQLIPHHVIASDRELAAAQAAIDQIAHAPSPSASAPGVLAAWQRREEAEWEHQQATEKFFEEKDEAQAARLEARASYARRLRERLRLTTAELTPEEAALKDLLNEKEFDALVAKEQLAAYKVGMRSFARTGDFVALRGPFKLSHDIPPVTVPKVALSALQDAYAVA